MRKLHAVAPNEAFIASGEYRYWRDGQPLSVVEKFTIHELAGGAKLYRVDEDGRREDGLTILSEALISPDNKFERCNVRSDNARDELLQDFAADYTFNPDYVQIGRKVGNDKRDYEEFEFMVDTEIYIKQTLYMGLTIQHLLAQDNKSHVFSPQLLSIGENLLQKIIVKEVDSETLEVGRKSIETRKFQIADDVFYWLDSNFIPMKRTYTHDGVRYEVKMANYAHR